MWVFYFYVYFYKNTTFLNGNYVSYEVCSSGGFAHTVSEEGSVDGKGGSASQG